VIRNMTEPGSAPSDAPVLALLLRVARPTAPSRGPEDGAAVGRGRLEELLPAPTASWDDVLDTFAYHRLTPLLFRRVADAGLRGHIPPAALGRLTDEASAVAARSLAHARALVELVRKLTESGIRSLAFKGPVLAQELDGDLGLRFFRDIDVLVAEEDFPRAQVVVDELGYALHPAAARAGPSPVPHHHVAYTRGQVILELHRTLLSPYRGLEGRLDALWERRRSRTLAGTDLPTLGAEDEILHLSVHGSGHAWFRLRWLADLPAWLNAHPDVDWEGLLAAARAHRFERAFLLGWRLAREHLGVELPGALSVAERRCGALDALARRCATAWVPPVHPMGDEGRFAGYQLRLLEGWSNRAWFVRAQGLRIAGPALVRALASGRR
jgi:hypothetical protein